MKVGEKVVCIDDMFTEHAKQLIPNRPKKDLVYVIRDMVYHPEIPAMGLLLEEIVNPILPHHMGNGEFEPTFSAHRFVPLDWEVDEEKLEEVDEATSVF